MCLISLPPHKAVLCYEKSHQKLKEAIAVLEDGMKGTLADYTIASVTETQLMDVFPFDANSIPGEKKSGEELIAEQKQQAEQRG